MTPRITWLSEKDGIGHAHVGRGRVIRAACGRAAVDPRHSWPTTSSCSDCVTAVNQIKASAAGVRSN